MKSTALLQRGLLCLLLLLPAPAAFARFLAQVPPDEDCPVVPFTPQADNRPSDLRFLSFNVHHCEGTDTVLKPERVSWVIKQYMPHIVALQELDSVTTRTGGVDQLQVLAQANFMHPTYAATIPYQGGKYGLGILSQQKPLKTETFRLPGTEEPRLLLALWFPDFIFCCTHFSLTPQDRLTAAQLIAQKFEKADRPVFVAGDLNDVPGSEPLAALGRVFTPLTDVDVPTSPAQKPRRCIDYILGSTQHRGEYEVVESGVWRAQVKASDHLPVYARIRWTTPEKAMRVSAPNLQNPTQGGITVGWQTTHPAYGWVEYGRSAQALDRRARTLVDGQVVCNTTTQKIRLKDLEPGTTYYYRTGTREMTLYEGYRKNFGDTLYSPVYSFRTPPAADKDEDFTVLIFDDLHQNRATIDSLMHHVRERGIGYDLVVFNGDVISDPKDLPQAAAYLQHICKAVDAAQVPVVFVRGNHEIRNAYSIGLREILDFLGPTTYGAFNWGTTRFVVLDCGEDKPDDTPVYYDLNEFSGFREEQRDFLAAELPSPAFRQAAKRVLISHVPLYRAEPQTKPQPCRELWRPLIDAANPTFDLAIAGHVHRYGYTPVGADGNRFPAYTVGGSTPAVANVVVLSYRAGQLSWDFVPGKGL